MFIIMNKTIIIIRMRTVGALETVPLRMTFNFKQIGLDVPEIFTFGNSPDTEKTTEDVKKRHGFDWFLLAIFSLSKLMYDCLNYELCHVNNNINSNINYNRFHIKFFKRYYYSIYILLVEFLQQFD